jgi:hypothetical protein
MSGGVKRQCDRALAYRGWQRRALHLDRRVHPPRPGGGAAGVPGVRPGGAARWRLPERRC